MNGLSNDFYHDNPSSNSPRSRVYSSQQLNRQGSRQFDGFASQDGVYDDMHPHSHFDQPRYGSRIGSNMHGGFGGFDAGVHQAWNSSGFAQNQQLAALGATTRVRPQARGNRGALPQMWLEQQQQQPGYNAFVGSSVGFSPMRSEQLNAEGDDELIPTAIVIKNIPFAVKKEQLTQVMTEMGLPLPYAFNYHFDNGVFRGLAFANFTTPDETAQVIQGMNHLDLHGRKLRVEYKKMLPQAERDRIEREKRERRGQLEEQHRPMAGSSLQTQQSMSSLSSHVQTTSPSPLGRGMSPNIDMNDPTTLHYYSKLLLFQTNPDQGDMFAFQPDLPSGHRTIIHGLAHQLGLGHESHGAGEERRVHIYRTPGPSAALHALDPNRRQLNRAATTDFTNVRSNEASLYGGPATQSSGFLGAFADSQGGLSAGSNLRAAKSFADLRSYTPSPAQSASSFPAAALATNMSRFQDYAPASPNSSRSNVTPTTSTVPDSILNGMNSMNLGAPGFGQNNDNNPRLRGISSWDRETSGPGPIGSHRAYSGNHDDAARRNQVGSLRQQRGTLPDRTGGYARGRQGHQPRGSDELSSPSGVEIVVE